MSATHMESAINILVVLAPLDFKALTVPSG